MLARRRDNDEQQFELPPSLNTVSLRRISFFSEIRSPQSVTPFFCQNAPFPPKSNKTALATWQSPYRLVRIEKIKLSSVGVVVRPCVRNSHLSKSTTGSVTKKAAAARQGRQRRLDDEGSGGATTNAEPAAAQQRRQQQHNDKGRTSGATRKGAAARQRRMRRRNDKGRTGGTTMKGAAAQQ